MKISDLPRRHRELCIKRIKEQGNLEKIKGHGGDKDSIASGTILLWSNTPEGKSFWSKIKKAEKRSELPSIPRDSLLGTSEKKLLL